MMIGSRMSVVEPMDLLGDRRHAHLKSDLSGFGMPHTRFGQGGAHAAEERGGAARIEPMVNRRINVSAPVRGPRHSVRAPRRREMPGSAEAVKS